MHRYTPAAEPQASDLGTVGKLTDYFEEEEQKRWADACRQPEILVGMTDDIGSSHAVEIDGDLHVHGNFDVAQHRIAALWIKGDLVVDGFYSDQAHPQAFVLIEGDLRARSIITGAQLEVHGNVATENLVGDYNDYGATFLGSTRATTFFAEHHNFQFLDGLEAALTLDGGQTSQESSSMNLYVSTFVGEEYVNSYGEVDSRALIKALVKGKDILRCDPRNPSGVTRIRLVERRLETLPESLFLFVNLENLILDDNKLQRLDGLGRLSKLRHLSIVGNPIDSLPEELIDLPLKTLNLGYWTDLPEWFSRLEDLETLEIVVEELETIPEVVASIPALERLVLADWPASWQPLLDDLVSKLKVMSLQQLRISSGPVTHLPDDLSPFGQLKVLELVDQAFNESERSRIVQELPDVNVSF